MKVQRPKVGLIRVSCVFHPFLELKAKLAVDGIVHESPSGRDLDRTLRQVHFGRNRDFEAVFEPIPEHPGRQKSHKYNMSFIPQIAYIAL